jgi:predicted PurR-regulated permease PerM
MHLAASLLLVWSVLISMLDNLLRPLLIRRGVNLSMILILSGVIGGLFAFGIAGLFIGPVILAVTSTLLMAWINEPASKTPNAVPEGETAITDRTTATDTTSDQRASS